MSTWNTIHDNFVTLMSTSITGSVSRSYTESSAVDLKTRSSEPSSIWDGAYSILNNGMDSTYEFMNGYADAMHNVVLQVAYELSHNDEKALYNQASNEIVEIIRKRLDVNTYQGTLLNVTHDNTSGFQFVGRPDSETFAVVEIAFKINSRITTG